MIGVLSVVLMLVALQGTVAGEWTTVAQEVSTVIVIIAFMGFIIGALVKR